jgi:hypothetical protein
MRALIAALALSLAACGAPRHPPDRVLRDRFRRHRAAFEELRDRSVAADDEPGDQRGRRLMSQLGIDSIFPFRDCVEMWVSTVATSYTTGSTLSYAWCREVPEPIVFDTQRAERANSTGEHFARLDGGWYIQLHWDGQD